MHERGVAKDLVRTAGLVAVDQGGRRVRAMRIEIGAASHIEPDSLIAQVQFHARGTVADGADVIVERRALPAGVMPSSEDERVMLLSVDVED